MVLRRLWARLVASDAAPALSSSDVEGYKRLLNEGTRIIQAASRPDQFEATYCAIRDTLWSPQDWDYDEQYYTRRTLRRKKSVKAVQQIPGLAEVFLFHQDGYVREAALQQLDTPLTAPASIYALFWRTNDWVPEVREAAHEALARVLPQTSADVIVPALKAALPRIASWGRWSQAGPERITTLAQRDDVASALVDDVIQSESAALTVVFRELCKTPKIDPQLERIFRTAHQPHIRAMALQTLLSGKARWPLPQRRKVWIDKPSGRSRMELQFQSRDITVDADVLGLLQRAVTDRASIVRKHALDGMIALRHDREMAHTLDALVAGLEDDPNSGVRSRVAFFQRKRREENP
ncbi:hypothetical protein HGG73_14900 [Rhodobacteraceae bacterium R_SAG3]|nr:hypothetical protein [Rhodobacteraceae bacterium R_SAG3]